MNTTLKEILQRRGIAGADTVYEKDLEIMGNYVIASGDFWDVIENKEEYRLYETTSGSEELEALSYTDTAKMRENELNRKIKEIKKKYSGLSGDEAIFSQEDAQEIKRLRTMKKAFSQEKEPIESRLLICYKGNLYAASFHALCSAVPCIEGVTYKQREEMPLFTRNILRIKEAREQGRPLGISGGPCLFGVHEVRVLVTDVWGKKSLFDFSTGRNAIKEKASLSLAKKLYDCRDEISKITFQNQKSGITSQEYASLLYLFEYARAFHARLAIPLPDMSYIKYFEAVTNPLPPQVAHRAVKCFEKTADTICNLYLDVIQNLGKKYPDVEYTVIHRREEELCSQYYREREKFLSEAAVRRLTRTEEKTDAVLDYITMPALPYYLWGIRDIIQIDSLDEADSYRKCAKIHKNAIRLCALLYPEHISRDGIHTVFYAPLEYKEYGERQ